MTYEQGMIVVIGVLATAVATLFKLLLSARRDQTAELVETQRQLAEERRARYEYVAKKLEETEASLKVTRASNQTMLDVTSSQVSGALPAPPPKSQGPK